MRALATLGLLALLSGCALRSTPHHDYSSAYDGTPLRARIVDVTGRLLVSTNRPAHVAVFEIVPGRGVGLLYPAYTSEDSPPDR